MFRFSLLHSPSSVRRFSISQQKMMRHDLISPKLSSISYKIDPNDFVSECNKYITNPAFRIFGIRGHNELFASLSTVTQNLAENKYANRVCVLFDFI